MLTMGILILLTAALNLILGVIALSKGRTKLNVSFFLLNILLASWNVSVFLRDWSMIPVFDLVLYAVIPMFPASVFYFVMNIFGVAGGRAGEILKAFITAGIALSAVALAAIFVPAAAWVANSYGIRMAVFIFDAIGLIAAFVLLLQKYGKLTFRQERTRMLYIILGFMVMFTGAMLDFTGGFKWHRLMYMGELANAVYVVIIFTAIFRHRLFDSGLIFKNFIIYTVISVAAAAVLMTAHILFGKDLQFSFLISFLFVAALVFYADRMHQGLALFIERISGRSGSEEAAFSYNYIKELNIGEEEKIRSLLSLFRDFFELNAAVYIRQGNYLVKKWETQGTGARNTVECEKVPRSVAIRYEMKTLHSAGFLDLFPADIALPMRPGLDTAAVITGRKQTADISFTEDEVILMKNIAETIGLYINAYLLQQKLVEEENLKRIGLMAHQMAHEIKNPLAALWGAAQLLDGKTDAEKENVGIIKDEMRRLTGILDGWSDFARELKLEKESVDINSVIAEAVKVLNLQGHEVEIIVGGHEGRLMLDIDADRMKQVFINIMLNSIQALANSPSPRIKISIVKTDGFADIKLRDNGPGIAPENMAKIKQPLFTNKPGGSGLGLAVSDRIVRAHGGTLIMDSDGKSYTQATISLPLD